MEKRFLTLSAGMVLLALATACGSDNDEPKPDRIEKVSMAGVVTKTVAGTTGLPFDVNSSLDFTINYTAKTVDVMARGLRFSVHQPVTVDLNFEGCKATFADDRHFTIAGTGFTPMDGYTVNDVSGTVDLALNTVILKYQVVSTRSTSQIYAFSPVLYSELPHGEANYGTTSESYYKFQYSIDDAGAAVGNIRIYNISFTEGMPKLAEIRIPIDGDGTVIVPTTTGYHVTGTGIVPYYTQGGAEVPMASRTINDLDVTIDVAARTYNVEFDCYGMHVKHSGNLHV